MTCEQLIAAYFSSLGEKFACSVQPNGRLCVVTPYVYPDHDNVEVFVREKNGNVVVSDLGETIRHLDALGMDVLDTPNLAYTAYRIADGFKVRIVEGVILKEGAPETVGRLVFEVLSVSKAVGDLVYCGKAYRPVNFTEEVTEFLKSNQLQYDPKVSQHGASGTIYTVDFRVWLGGTKAALVEALSPPKSSGIRRKVNATFRMWADINGNARNNVSLLNDELLQFREEDITLLKKFSTVHRWTRRDAMLADLLQTTS